MKIPMKESLKNLAILALSLSAFYLLSQVEIFSRVSSFLLVEDSYTLEQVDWQGGEQLTAVLPQAIVALREENGVPLQIGLQYEEGRNELFSLTSQILKEALGNLSQVEEISQEDFCTALATAPSLFYQWQEAMPLSLLELYLTDGTTADTQGIVKNLLLSPWEDTMALCYQEDNRYFLCTIDALEVGRLESVLEHIYGSPQQFAFQVEGLSTLAPLTLMTASPMSKWMYQASTPFDTDLDTLLEKLGFLNSTHYSANDGLVIRGNTDSLRLSSEGQINYQVEETSRYILPKESLEITLLEQIEGCRLFAQQILQGLDTVPELHISYLSIEDAVIHIEFSASLQGIPLAYGDSMTAGVFTIYGEEIRSFSLWYRNYQPSDGMTPLLPVPQALSILETHHSNNLLLVYQDTGRDWVTATWVTP